MNDYKDCTHFSDYVFEAVLDIFEAAEPAPESYVRQHNSNADCWCGPIPVGNVGAWAHR